MVLNERGAAYSNFDGCMGLPHTLILHGIFNRYFCRVHVPAVSMVNLACSTCEHMFMKISVTSPQNALAILTITYRAYFYQTATVRTCSNASCEI